MYSKNLSASILSICDSQKLTYEAASELCDISPRYFGSIARGQTAASINMLEKICNGFNRMPNELLEFTTADKALSYKLGLMVTHFSREPFCSGTFTTYAVCPRCHGYIDREYQFYCPFCGQKLNWDCYEHATPLPPH